MSTPPAVTRDAVRRLAVRSQRLDGRPKRVGPSSIVDLVRDLGCLQIDPISVIAPTHLLVLWSRLGRFDTKSLERAMWKDRTLFHYWAHAASLVPTEDYPIHAFTMKHGAGMWSSAYQRHRQGWIDANKPMRRSILSQLKTKGPLRLRELDVAPGVPWQSTGWTNNQEVQRMIEFLWFEGKVTIGGRDGLQRIWDLMDRFLPEWTPKKALPRKVAVETSIMRALGALGVATQAHINYHYTRGRYPDMPQALSALEQKGQVTRVQVMSDGSALRGKWYARTDALEKLEGSSRDEPEPITRLLSPFDNLICDRKRTLTLWDFEYVIEIYVPKVKRRYGYYVLPILFGDRLVGRLDAAVDRETGTLSVLSVHTEPEAPREAGAGVAEQLADLAAFRGADDVVYPKDVPKVWARELR